MYSSEIKKDYVDNHALKTHKEPLKKAFAISEELENTYGKDIHDFNYDELEQLFNELSPKTISQGRKYFNALEEYIDWCTCQGYKRSNINILAITESTWADKFVIDSISNGIKLIKFANQLKNK